MRYYVYSIQYNKVVGAENRSVPKACDTLNDALTEYHDQLARDHKNKTLGWSICMVINSAMGVEAKEKYIADVTEEELSEV